MHIGGHSYGVLHVHVAHDGLSVERKLFSSQNLIKLAKSILDH